MVKFHSFLYVYQRVSFLTFAKLQTTSDSEPLPSSQRFRRPSLQKFDAHVELSAHPQSSRRRSQTSPAQDWLCVCVSCFKIPHSLQKWSPTGIWKGCLNQKKRDRIYRALSNQAVLSCAAINAFVSPMGWFGFILASCDRGKPHKFKGMIKHDLSSWDQVDFRGLK